MDSQPFDSSSDALGFTSEILAVPAHDSEPAFMRAPLGDPQYEMAFANGRVSSQRPRVWFVAMLSVALGVLGGFAAGYAFAPRLTAPAATSAPLGAPSSNAHIPPGDRLTEAARVPDAVAPTPPTDASPVAIVPTPSPAARPSPIRQQLPTTTATTHRAGSIEVLSHPRDAQVVVDGNAVGRTPISIPDVEEGTHEVRVELAGFRAWVTSVRVKDSSRARIGASLEVETPK